MPLLLIQFVDVFVSLQVRSVNAEEAIRLSPPILRSLEELISYMGQDEMLEVGPS